MPLCHGPPHWFLRSVAFSVTNKVTFIPWLCPCMVKEGLLSTPTPPPPEVSTCSFIRRWVRREANTFISFPFIMCFPSRASLTLYFFGWAEWHFLYSAGWLWSGRLSAFPSSELGSYAPQEDSCFPTVGPFGRNTLCRLTRSSCLVCILAAAFKLDC